MVKASLAEMVTTFLHSLTGGGENTDPTGLIQSAQVDGRLTATESAALLGAISTTRTEFERFRQRERAYRDLVESSADIAQIQDRDALLLRIASDARRLVRSDAAYVILRTRDGAGTQFGVASGAVSSNLARVRFMSGEGIAGRVLMTGMPFATRDYFNDPDVQFGPEQAAVMRQEGIVAAAGVPLRAGSQVLGVLCALSRTERVYSPSEIALLADLATHAAISMERTRLQAESAASILSLEAANHELDEARAESERAGKAHLKLTDVALAGEGLPGVARSVTDIVGGRLAVIDDTATVLTSTAQIDLTRPEVSRALAACRASMSSVVDADVVVTPIAASGHVRGHLVLEGVDPVHSVDVRIVERASVVAALIMLLGEQAEYRAAASLRELFRDLFSGRVELSQLVHRATIHHLDLTAPDLCVLVLRGEGSARTLAAGLQAAVQPMRGIAAEHGDDIVAIVPHHDSTDLVHLVRRALPARGPAILTASGPRPGLGGLTESLAEARRCASAMRVLVGADACGTMDDLGFAGLVLGSDPDTRGMIERALGPVLDYDRARGTSLTETLEHLLATAGSATATAKQMYIHVNTVKQRMERISRLLGKDWRDPSRSAEIYLALRLLRASQALNPDPAPSTAISGSISAAVPSGLG